MAGIYLCLGLVALIVAMFGLMAYAIHSSKLSNRRVMGELVELRKLLEREQQALREAQQEAALNKSVIHPLSKPEIQQRNSELEMLRLLILRQDEEIRLLQKDADDMRQSLARLSSTDGSMEPAVASLFKKEPRSTGDRMRKAPVLAVEPEPAMVAAASAASYGKGRNQSNYEPILGPQLSSTKEPSWKENLDGILSMLDAMEREVQN